MTRRTHMLPVWFFIGVLLAIYGAIILAVAVLNFHQLPATILAQYHPDLWCGILLLVIGCVYTISFWPSRMS